MAHGLATGDGIAGLRVLLTPEHKRIERRRSLRIISGGRSSERAMPVGRWSLWRNRSSIEPVSAEAVLEQRARQILRRYGVVFRDLLARETNLASWRALLGIYRRLEARGEIRGGRFVDGFVGEQFALPEALERLRAMRRDSSHQEAVIVSAADPLNLIGVITPGGTAIAILESVRCLRKRQFRRSGLVGRTAQPAAARSHVELSASDSKVDAIPRLTIR